MTDQPQQTRFPIALTSFGALLIIGILLPWAKLFYFVSVSGIELGEGPFMLILAILITCCGARTYFNDRNGRRDKYGYAKKTPYIVAVLLSLVSTAIVLIRMVDTYASPIATPSSGVFISLIGSAGALLTALIAPAKV